MNLVSHTRLLRYARGKIGMVVQNHGVFVFPDASVQGLGKKAQHVYSVRFAARELWGNQVSARDTVYVAMWDDYLEPAVFAEPWQATAFALAIRLSAEGHFTWKEWAATLADELKRAAARGEPDDGSRYYDHWLAALERLVVAKGLSDPASLLARKEAWADAYRHTPHGMPVELEHESGCRYLCESITANRRLTRASRMAGIGLLSWTPMPAVGR